MKRRIISLFLLIALCLPLSACGQTTGYGVTTIATLVSQDYYLAFRNDDTTYFYVTAALETLAAEGRVDELAVKWFGTPSVITIDKRAEALAKLTTPKPRNLIIGLDVNSFPLAYVSSGTYWGFDVELANAVCERLGWTLQMQSIEKENTYIELSSGNIDCAWGGIAISPEEIASNKLHTYGPYIHNDIVIAARAGSNIRSKLQLGGKKMCMSSTTEAMEALNTEEALAKRLGQVTRLAGGTAECFENLYAGKCDIILTDSTALLYFNCH